MNSLLFILALFGVWFFLLRTRKSPIASSSEFEARIRQNQPVIAEFFTNT
jgi:hypothetical protein